MNDIVYILRNDIAGNEDELRYSLRSLINFPHGKVWFYGGKPEQLKPDRQVEVKQKGTSPWEKVSWTLGQICSNKDVSDDFWLFNDDFFVMQYVDPDTMPPIYNSTLHNRVNEILERRSGVGSNYTIQLIRLRDLLLENGRKSYNYAVHIPMLINKRKAQEVLLKYPQSPMFRSLYGNYWDIGGVSLKDVKVFDKNIEPDADSIFLSTTETTFNSGLAGDFIKARFREKCKYEI